MAVHARAAVGVDTGSGRITAFETAPSAVEAAVLAAASDGGGGTVVVQELGPSQFLCPGFVDTHIHAPQFAYTGTATDVPLMRWLEVSLLVGGVRMDERG